jgi:hypothetical protein
VTVLRGLLLILGILAILMGLLWVGQGTGLVMWPAESFMLAERAWAVRGALLAAVGLVLVWLSRRR